MAEANEQEQMKMAFMDDGMERDPISGNEIPTGSLAEEVRDDIPAMLSEGEYVVPADVLRFYGIKFFEDLRIKAKDGLARMESMGRIGGEPVEEESTASTMPTSEDSNVLPFPIEELETEEEEIEMAVGGVIKAAEGTLVEKGIETVFSPAGMAVGLSPAAAILANATGADKRIYKALFDSTATFTGRDRGPVITGTASENKEKFYKNLASKSARALLKLGVPLSVMMPDEMGDGTISEELLDKLEFTENKKAQGGVINAQEGIAVSAVPDELTTGESGFRQVQYWNGQDESTIFTATFIGDVSISHSPTQLEGYVPYVSQADEGKGGDKGDSSASKETREERIKRRNKEKFRDRFEKQEEITKKLYPEGFGSERIARTYDEIFDYAKQLKGFGPMNIGIDDIITKIPGIGDMTSGLLAKQHKDILEDAKKIYDDPEAYDNLSDERKVILDNLIAGAEGYTPARSFLHKGIETVAKPIKKALDDEKARKKRKKRDKDFFSPTSKNAKQSLTKSEFEKKEERRKKATEGYGGGRNKGGLMRKGKK